jgi:hypothetical protein
MTDGYRSGKSGLRANSGTGLTWYKLAIVALCLIAIFQSLVILHFLPKKRAEKKKPAAPVSAAAGRIAIVLDDWGYNLNNLELLKEIPYPMTISILPGLAYSKRVAGEASRNGLEVVLHLPLEPFPSENVRLENNTVLTNMQEEMILQIFRKDLDGIPGVKGVSNHMGSKATADIRVMGILFKEMRRRSLYFLDSLVSGKSVCTEAARKMKVSFAKRDIFLDNSRDPQYIKGQIEKLKARAGKSGFAIGVGHDRRTTLEVLKEVLPELKKQGYRLVFVSELAG